MSFQDLLEVTTPETKVKYKGANKCSEPSFANGSEVNMVEQICNSQLRVEIWVAHKGDDGDV